MTCNHCHRENPEGSFFCKFCGEKHLLTCKHCDAVLDVDNIYCHMCGVKVELSKNLSRKIPTNPTFQETTRDHQHPVVPHLTLMEFTENTDTAINEFHENTEFTSLSLSLHMDEEEEEDEPLVSSAVPPEPTDPSFFEIEDGVLEKYTGYGVTTVVVPEGVVKIGSKAFHSSDVMSVILPTSLRSIGDEAFLESRQLEEITFAEGLETIGFCAFFLCTSLTVVTLPSTVTHIESAAFSFCRQLISIQLSQQLRYLGSQAFQCSESIEEITIPTGVSVLEEGTFSGCHHLKKLVIPPSVVVIRSGDDGVHDVFQDCEFLTIYGDAGSIAQSIALEMNLPFLENMQ